MDLKESIMYHIHKTGIYDDIWYIGNNININESFKNNFTMESFQFKFCLDFHSQSNVPFSNVYAHVKDFNNYAKDQVNEWFRDKDFLLEKSNIFISEYGILVREMVYEQIRSEYYPELPSRLHCVWLCRENQLELWKNNLSNESKIFKVKVTGNCYKGKNQFISLPSDSYNTITEKAHQYWKPDIQEDIDDEYLFNGKLEILEQL